jgi:hypothetical protein
MRQDAPKMRDEWKVKGNRMGCLAEKTKATNENKVQEKGHF